MVHCRYSLSLFQVCNLTLGPKHPKHRFLTKNTPFWRIKAKKSRYLLKVRNFLSHDEGDCQTTCLFPNEAFSVAKSALGPHGANPPHIHMHTGKNWPIFQNKGFPLSSSWIWCRWSPQDRWTPPGHPQDTPPARCCRPPIRPDTCIHAYMRTYVRAYVHTYII